MLNNRNYSLTKIGGNFDKLTSLTHAPGEPNYFYVTEQRGVIYKVNRNTGARSEFLNIEDFIPKLNPGYDERGLLGLCFHPEYVSQGRFYIFYSATPEHVNQTGYSYYNVLSEIQVSDMTEEILLVIPKEHTFHNSGNILIDSNGMLYLSVGDGGPQGDPEEHAQNLNSLLGKILRIDVSDPSVPYTIPSDNPFPRNPLIYAYGLRNVWGMSFGRGEVLFAADVGYNDREEVDIIIRGGNYGWNIKEGTKITGLSKRSTANLIDPIYEYETHHPGGYTTQGSAIIGGYQQGNRYIFGDYGGVIMEIENNNGWRLVSAVKSLNEIRAFGRDSTGQVYVLTASEVLKL